jgi:hypothetical protein
MNKKNTKLYFVPILFFISFIPLFVVSCVSDNKNEIIDISDIGATNLENINLLSSDIKFPYSITNPSILNQKDVETYDVFKTKLVSKCAAKIDDLLGMISFKGNITDELLFKYEFTSITDI